MHLFNRWNYLLLLLLAAFSWQCQSSTTAESQVTYFAELEVRYLADGDQLRGMASFLRGDSLANARPVSFSQGVAFMGSGTQQKQFPDGRIRYENTIRTPYEPPVRFGLSTLEQKEQLIELNFPMDGINNFAVKSANKTDGLRVEIDGSLAKNESLLLLFTDAEQNAKTILRPGPISKGDLYIPADALTHFTIGEYRLYFVKSKEFVGQQDQVQYHAIVEYYTSEKTFTLE